MRVSFFVNNYAPSPGGVQEHIGRVAEGLVARHGFEVDVLTSDAVLAPGGPDPGHLPVGDDVWNGVRVHRRPVARRCHGGMRTIRRAGRRLGCYDPGDSTLFVNGPLGARYAITARRLARSSDAVIGVSAPTASLWYASKFTPSGVAKVAMPLLHIGAGQDRPWVLGSLRRADAVVANTPVEARWMVDHGVVPSRVRVLSPGCDPDDVVDASPPVARRHLGLAEGPTIGFVGRMAVHKGVDHLLRAMGHVWAAHPEANLLLAGPDAGVDLGRLLDELGPSERDRVRVWGRFADEDRPWLIAACDVLAHPSSSESFGMVVIEAWNASRPVVVADIDVTRELIRDGVDGLLVGVGESSALAGALTRLLDSSTERLDLGRAGRRRAVGEFDWTGIVDRWAELLDVAVVRSRERSHA